MNWLDAVIVFTIAWSGLKGRRQGLIWEVLLTGSAALALALALRIAPTWATTGSVHYGLGQSAAYALAFGLIIVAVVGGGYFATHMVDRRISYNAKGARINRWGGFLVGGAKGAIVVLIVMVALLQTPWPAAHRAVSDSPLALWLLRAAPTVYAGAQLVIPQRSP